MQIRTFAKEPAGRMRLALFEPDIPQNCGTILRLASCLGVAADIIEPCGFLWDDRRLRRAGMDYLAGADVTRHESWAAFERQRQGRLLLLTTKAERSYLDMAFSADDVLLLGRETAGVPEAVHHAADARLRIPMRAGQRSINVALAASMVLGEALRQTKGFPG
jgi:tRNA (cytidine/uridine-2'-O-)-methyltransferase